MRQLRIFRIFLTIMFIVASAVYLLLGPQFHPMACVSEKSQIILSALSSTIGTTLVWLVMTMLFGRIYCSSVCPVGTIADGACWLRKKIGIKPVAYSYKPSKRLSVHILLVYIICLLIGFLTVPFIIEPWRIMQNATSIVRPSNIDDSWVHLGKGVATGASIGLASLVAIFIYSLYKGRDYCTQICPYGTALGLVHEHTLFHIEIDPLKCTSCGQCEDNCKASCIKVSTRLVDNSRCVRCFDCLAVCPNDAIRFQINRNRPVNPLFQRKSAQSQ